MHRYGGRHSYNTQPAASPRRCTQPSMHFKTSFHPLLEHLTMKTFQLILLSLICVAKSYGQTVAKNYYGRIDVEISKEKRSKNIYTKVEIKSAFPGGDSAWVKSIENNINRSIGVGKRVKKGKYIVSVKFILSKDGNLSDIACENDPGYGMCEEVIRVLKKITKWTPAEPVKVREYRVTNQ